MDKDEIKKTILSLALPNELESIIIDMIDQAKEVNAALLNTIANILDNQADYYDAYANALEQAEEAQEVVNAELGALEAEKYSDKLEAYSKYQDNQQKLINPTPNDTAETNSPANSPVVEETVSQVDTPSTSPEQENIASSEPEKTPAVTDQTYTAETPSISPEPIPQPTFVPPTVETINTPTQDPAMPAAESAPTSEYKTEAEEERQEAIADVKEQITQMDENSAAQAPAVPTNPAL